MKWRLYYVWLVLKAWPVALISCPLYTLKLTYYRTLFSLFRRFIGPSFTSIITGEKIFNSSSLINAFAIHIIKELSIKNWENNIRETAQPVVFDVGSNLGQFSWYIKSLNPGAKCITIDAWSDMKVYNNVFDDHYVCAIHDFKKTLNLNKSDVGLTASTSDLYTECGLTETVSCNKLDTIWKNINCPKVALLKIDVDGGEINVILSASKMLQHTKYILVEINSAEALDFFTSRFGNGFTKNGYDYLFCANQ